MSEEGERRHCLRGGHHFSVRGGGAWQCPRGGGDAAASDGGAAAFSLSLPCMLGLRMYAEQGLHVRGMTGAT